MKRIITVASIATGIALLAATSTFAAVSSGSLTSTTAVAIEGRAPGMHMPKGGIAPGVQHLDRIAEILTTAEDRAKYVEILKAQRTTAKATLEALKTKHESAHIALQDTALSEFAVSGDVSDATETAFKTLNETTASETRTAMESQKTSLETALKSAFGDEVAAKLLPSKSDMKAKLRGKIKDRMKERRGSDRSERGAPTAPAAE